MLYLAIHENGKPNGKTRGLAAKYSRTTLRPGNVDGKSLANRRHSPRADAEGAWLSLACFTGLQTGTRDEARPTYAHVRRQLLACERVCIHRHTVSDMDALHVCAP